jgi:hypothetical protein
MFLLIVYVEFLVVELQVSSSYFEEIIFILAISKELLAIFLREIASLIDKCFCSDFDK